MARYFARINNVLRSVKALVTSSGAADADKIVATNADGIIDDTLINSSEIGGAGAAHKRGQLNALGQWDESMFPAGFGEEVQAYPCSENLSAGNAVQLWNDAGTVKVRKADNVGKPADGYVNQAYTSGQSANMYKEGIVAVTGATVGPVFLGTNGGYLYTNGPADADGVVHQSLGYATSSTTISWDKGEPYYLVA